MLRPNTTTTVMTTTTTTTMFYYYSPPPTITTASIYDDYHYYSSFVSQGAHTANAPGRELKTFRLFQVGCGCFQVLIGSVVQALGVSSVRIRASRFLSQRFCLWTSCRLLWLRVFIRNRAGLYMCPWQAAKKKDEDADVSVEPPKESSHDMKRRGLPHLKR